MKIDVTEEDIRNGKRNDGCCCPVARAMNRHVVAAEVGRNWITYNFNRERETPESVKQFVSCFDRGEPVKPFSFELKILAPMSCQLFAPI